MEPITDIEFNDIDAERFRRVQGIYTNGIGPDEESMSEGSERGGRKWFSSCRRQPFRGRRTVSEASVYRTCSKYSVKSISTTGKTLDYLMQCFWLCSPGCQQTA